MQKFFLFLTVFLVPTTTLAHIAITEVMWMGSDLSTSDEWVELASDGPDDIDISGWTLTSLNTKGEHALILRFATGTVIDSEQVMIIANAPATASRLLGQPDIVTTAMSLPNSKLLLMLRDAAGNVVDQVDDGVGAPFAGANPSGGTKASMERIALDQLGTISTNWMTATTSSGLDQGANVLGSPASFAFALPPTSEPPPSGAPAAPACTDPLQVQIYVQDGSLSAVGHTTVNFQAIATVGSMATAACRWAFSDGFTSDSCNPPPHAFTQVGTTSVNLEVINQCGNTLKQDIKVEVLPDPSTLATSSTEKPTSQFDGSRLMLSSALPNPEGAETGHEWVEIRNREQRPVNLLGWTLAVGKTSIKKYTLQGSIESLSRLRLYNSEMKFSIPNTESQITLIDPTGREVSKISWRVAEEGIEYYSDDIREIDVSGIVVSVIDGDTFVLGLEGQAREVLDADSVHVRLLGIDAPELLSSQPYSYEAREYLLALLEKQRVELEFDTELWDTYGRLLAYVSLDTGTMVDRSMLSIGLAKVTKGFPLAYRDDFENLEADAKAKKIGIWSLDLDKVPTAPGTIPVASHALGSDDSISPEATVDSSILISEIYASPSTDVSAKSKSDGALMIKQKSINDQIMYSYKTDEWIELLNTGVSSVDLRDYKLAINGKVKSISFGIPLGSGQYYILKVSDLKLLLKNSGTVVSLLSPDGQEISSVLYPELRQGSSYAWDSASDEYCVTIQPTPGALNVCKVPVAKMRKSTAKKLQRLTAYAQDLQDSASNTALSLDPATPDSDTTLFLIVLFAGCISLGCVISLLLHYRRMRIG